MKLSSAKLKGLCFVGLLACALGGCDEPNARAVRPTTKPSAVVATGNAEPAPIAASFTLKPPSVLSIDSKKVEFPAAKLVVLGRGTSGYTLLLCSDDPPTAIDPGYAGNSYNIQMRVPIDRLSDLPGTIWTYKPGEVDDSACNISIHGYRGQQLRPVDLIVRFQKDGTQTAVVMTGTFSHSDNSNPANPPIRVSVEALLSATDPE